MANPGKPKKGTKGNFSADSTQPDNLEKKKLMNFLVKESVIKEIKFKALEREMSLTDLFDDMWRFYKENKK